MFLRLKAAIDVPNSHWLVDEYRGLKLALFSNRFHDDRWYTMVYQPPAPLHVYHVRALLVTYLTETQT